MRGFRIYQGSLSIIIPAYNEEEGLDRALGRLMPVAREKRCDVIVSNDGSTDKTAEVAAHHGAKVVAHPVNMGYGAALKTGIRMLPARALGGSFGVLRKRCMRSTAHR